MSTNFPQIQDLTLQAFFDGMTTCVRNIGTGAAPAAAPDAFKDRFGETILAQGPAGQPNREFSMEIRTNPDGLTATIKIRSLGPSAAPSLQGTLDIATLAALLA